MHFKEGVIPSISVKERLFRNESEADENKGDDAGKAQAVGIHDRCEIQLYDIENPKLKSSSNVMRLRVIEGPFDSSKWSNKLP